MIPLFVHDSERVIKFEMLNYTNIMPKCFQIIRYRGDKGDYFKMSEVYMTCKIVTLCAKKRDVQW